MDRKIYAHPTGDVFGEWVYYGEKSVHENGVGILWGGGEYTQDKYDELAIGYSEDTCREFAELY